MDRAVQSSHLETSRGSDGSKESVVAGGEYTRATQISRSTSRPGGPVRTFPSETCVPYGNTFLVVNGMSGAKQKRPFDYIFMYDLGHWIQLPHRTTEANIGHGRLMILATANAGCS